MNAQTPIIGDFVTVLSINASHSNAHPIGFVLDENETHYMVSFTKENDHQTAILKSDCVLWDYEQEDGSTFVNPNRIQH